MGAKEWGPRTAPKYLTALQLKTRVESSAPMNSHSPERTPAPAMSNSSPCTRRGFLRTALAASTAPLFLKSSVLGRAGAISLWHDACIEGLPVERRQRG